MMEDIPSLPLSEVLKRIQEGIVSRRNTYCGIYCVKNPVDVWTYAQIIWETRPTLLIELGTFYGGSAVMFHHMLQTAGGGRVVSIDPWHGWLDARAKEYPIQFLQAPAAEAIGQIEIRPDDRVMVVEDSLHTYDCTLAHLRVYGPIVTPGCYMVVEDTNFNHGLPGPAAKRIEDGREVIYWDGKPYPDLEAYRAVETFVGENSEFEIDRDREPFFVTGNPKGFLRRRCVG